MFDKYTLKEDTVVNAILYVWSLVESGTHPDPDYAEQLLMYWLFTYEMLYA